MPVVPPSARRSTLNINSLHAGQPETTHGGLPTPCVADSARMIIDRRFLVEEDVEGVKAQVRAVLDALADSRRGFRYSLRELFEVGPVMIDPATPVARLTALAVREVLGR